MFRENLHEVIGPLLQTTEEENTLKLREKMVDPQAQQRNEVMNAWITAVTGALDRLISDHSVMLWAAQKKEFGIFKRWVETGREGNKIAKLLSSTPFLQDQVFTRAASDLGRSVKRLATAGLGL